MCSRQIIRGCSDHVVESRQLLGITNVVPLAGTGSSLFVPARFCIMKVCESTVLVCPGVHVPRTSIRSSTDAREPHSYRRPARQPFLPANSTRPVILFRSSSNGKILWQRELVWVVSLGFTIGGQHFPSSCNRKRWREGVTHHKRVVVHPFKHVKYVVSWFGKWFPLLKSPGFNSPIVGIDFKNGTF